MRLCQSLAFVLVKLQAVFIDVMLYGSVDLEGSGS